MTNTYNTYTPLQVANTVVKIAQSENKEITNLKLQKVLYFLQASFLVENNTPLIDGKFSRWQYGPVLRSVYEGFRKYGPTTIDNTITAISRDNGKLRIERPVINDDDANYNYIQERVVELLTYTSTQLVDATHEQDLWKDKKEDIASKTAPDYTNEEITDYFNNHEEDWLWKKKK